MDLSENHDSHAIYLSQQTAWNAMLLHRMKNPKCYGINVFACEDHFHIGHINKESKEFCLETEIPIRRG